MAMDGLRGYLQLASGLAEMSRARATEAATALLSLSSGLTGGRPSSAVQVQVQDLAEELLTAAAANRRSLIALVRSEVDRALDRSPIPPDELDRARTAIAKLSADLEELRTQVLGNSAVGEVASRLGLVGSSQGRSVGSDLAPAVRDGDGRGVVVDAAFADPVDATAEAPPRRRPPRGQIAGRAAATTAQAGDTTAATTTTRKAANGKKAPATEAGTTKTATRKAGRTTAGTRKAGTRKAGTRKAASSSTPPKGTATTRTTTKSTPTKKTAKKATTKTTATKKSTSKNTPAKRTSPTKSAATKSAATKAASRAGGSS